MNVNRKQHKHITESIQVAQTKAKVRHKIMYPSTDGKKNVQCREKSDFVFNRYGGRLLWQTYVLRILHTIILTKKTKPETAVLNKRISIFASSNFVHRTSTDIDFFFSMARWWYVTHVQTAAADVWSLFLFVRERKESELIIDGSGFMFIQRRNFCYCIYFLLCLFVSVDFPFVV